jgi:hypothetical protein
MILVNCSKSASEGTRRECGYVRLLSHVSQTSVLHRISVGRKSRKFTVRPDRRRRAERSWRYCFGTVVDGDAGVAVGELVVAGAWDSVVWLRGQNTAATTIITTITATIAYKKRLSPKKFIITSLTGCGKREARAIFIHRARSTRNIMSC